MKTYLLSLLTFCFSFSAWGQTAGFVDPTTPANVQPVGISGDWDLEFSDEFNATEIDTTRWIVSVSTKSRAPRPNLGINDWWWVEQNAFLDGQGHLALRATKVDHNTMHCGSVESRGLYEPTFGYLEARIQIAETAKGNHTAFWMQGKNQSNVNNSAADGAEVDIFESAWLANNTKAVVHFDGYGAQKKNHTIPYNTPNLHSGFHVFGLHWTASQMDIYYDGVKVQSTNPNKPFPFTVNPNGYPLVPQVPEWLWLSVGASFGDGDFLSQPVGNLSDALVDYVRVFQPTPTVGINKPFSDPHLRLYPNPTQGLLHIDSDYPQYQLCIYDLHGRRRKQSQHSFSSVIDLTAFEKGIYLLQIESPAGLSHHRVFVQ